MLYPLDLPLDLPHLHSQATQVQEATGLEHQWAAISLTPLMGCNLDLKDLGPMRPSPGRGNPALHMSPAPPQGRDLALGSQRHGMVQLLEALEAPLRLPCVLKTSVK